MFSHCALHTPAWHLPLLCHTELKTEAAMKEMRGNIEEYLGRAEKIKGFVKEERDGEC